MPTYTAPLKDIHFLYQDVFKISENLQSIPQFSEFDNDTIQAIAEEAARFVQDILLPLNQVGDEEGCSFSQNKVTTPSGFKEAYKNYVENSWGSLICDTQYGGQGLPKAIGTILEELTCSGNISFGLYPGLTHGSYSALYSAACDEQKKKYLPNLVSGHWAGTMCLTEAHCGTDLGLIKTKAIPNEDQSYAITGTKIFISSGDHDLTENIIHLVLARLPNAPAGIKGISLFIVPKFLSDDNNQLLDRNPVFCGAIEKKMGMHGSSTCVMNFDQAKGWLVGIPNEGMKAMFVMMNEERLAVGVQGLGLSEISYQNALAYAKDRLQGRGLTKVHAPEKIADPIIVHADIRRMLLTMKSLTEGGRALCLWISYSFDMGHHANNLQERQQHYEHVQLMTPIVKAFLTDLSTEITNLGVQIHGGYGYIKEYGMEQYVRDARITQIYEGTNSIQALDLIGRKIGAHNGRYLRFFFHEVSNYLAKHCDDPLAQHIHKAFKKLQQATLYIAEKSLSDYDTCASVALEYLHFFGYVTYGYLWHRIMKEAEAKKSSDPYYSGKIKTGQFYIERILPRHLGLFLSIVSGKSSSMNLKNDEF